MTIGAFSIILDTDNRVLLCKRRDRDLWNLPGGRLEGLESPWETAIRETQEEIGVQIGIEKLAGVYYKKEKDDLVFQFVSKIKSGEPALSDEVAEIGYFSADSLPENTAPLQKQRITLFFDNPDLVRIVNQ